MVVVEMASHADCTCASAMLKIFSASCIGISCLILMVGCATPPSDKSWLRIGVTRNEAVIKHYGEPDLVQASAEGDLVLYRAAAATPASTVDVPTFQPGPSGTMVTKSNPIEPGLGAKHVSAGTDERPQKDMRIRYDSYGIVREVLE